MILSGKGIRAAMECGQIIIHPFDERQLNPNSYDVRLGNKIVTYRNHVLLSDRHNPTETIEIDDKPFMLEPGRIYIASTLEYTETHYPWVPILHGKSSRGRLGLCVHATAGFGDVGFKGNWTLELYVMQPVMIERGMKIGQIVYTRLEGEPDKCYEGRFQGHTEPTAFIPDKN